MQMLLNSYTGLHVCICLYVCAHGGCVSEQRGPVIHGHSLGAIFSSDLREEQYIHKCLFTEFP